MFSLAGALRRRRAQGPTNRSSSDSIPARSTPPNAILLQTALAATGDYRGLVDGRWGPVSQGAIEAYAAREFGDEALNVHAASLVLGFLDEVEREAWELGYRPELGVSLALPLAVLGPPELEDGAVRRWSRTGSLTVLTRARTAPPGRPGTPPRPRPTGRAGHSTSCASRGS